MTSARDTGSNAVRSTRGTRGGLLAAVVLVLLGVAVGVWSAGSQGYIPPVWQGSWGCGEVGYPSPPPSFARLVEQYDESPHCARLVRDEAWF